MCTIPMKLRGLILSSYIHVSVSDLYILYSQDQFAYLAAANRQNDPVIPVYIAHRYINVEIGRQNIIILFRK